MALRAAKSVKRDTVQFVFGTRSKLFIRCLLVGVIETSHIMALKIKNYIISSLLLAHHYLRLIVDDHSYSGPGLSG